MKTFVARYGFIRSADNDLIGGNETNRHKQGSVFIKGKNKKAALEQMEKLGYGSSASLLRIGSGLDMNALLAADVLNEESVVIVPDNRPLYVARIWIDGEGNRQAVRIGEVVPDREAGTYADKFVPAP